MTAEERQEEKLENLRKVRAEVAMGGYSERFKEEVENEINWQAGNVTQRFSHDLHHGGSVHQEG